MDNENAGGDDEIVSGGDEIVSGGDEIVSGGDEIAGGGDEIVSGGDEIAVRVGELDRDLFAPDATRDGANGMLGKNCRLCELSQLDSM